METPSTLTLPRDNFIEGGNGPNVSSLHPPLPLAEPLPPVSSSDRFFALVNIGQRRWGMQQRGEMAKPRESDSHDPELTGDSVSYGGLHVVWQVILDALHSSETSVPNMKGTCRSTDHISILIVSGHSGT